MPKEPESTPVERLARAIADGRRISWDEEREKSHDGHLSGLEILDKVGRVFSGLGEEDDSVLFDWGPLRVLEKLGEGSFGEVYRALDPQLGRSVALKLRRETDTKSPLASEWLEEARRLARIRHRNVLTVHGAGRFDGREGIWSDLIEGENLRTRLRRDGPLGARELIAVGSAMLEALAAIHGAGMVHGDLKPSNIVREVGGRFVLVDFGSGEWIGSKGAASQGSPLTAAPERLRGEAPSERSDLYSLGATLYQLAAKRPPIEAESLDQLVEQSKAGLITPLRDLRPDLPAGLIAVIEQSLAHRPKDRFDSAGAMESALRAAETVDPPGDPGGPKGKPGWRLGIPIAALLVVVFSGWWVHQRPQSPVVDSIPNTVEVTRLQARGNPSLPAISPDGRYVAYLSDVGPRSSIRLLQVATGSDIELVQFSRDDRVNYLRFTPDGSFLRYTQAILGLASSVHEVPVLGGEPRLLFDGVLLGLTFAPDGREAAFIPGTQIDERWQQLDVLSLDDFGRRTVLTVDGSRDIESVAWSPQGDRLAISLADESADRLMVLPLSGSELQAVPDGIFFAISNLCWAPGGQKLIVVGAKTERDIVRQAWLIDAASGARRRIVSDVANSQGCSTSADGHRTVMTRNRAQSRLWSVPIHQSEAAVVVDTPTGYEDGLNGVAWLDEEWIAYDAPDGDTRNLWKVSVNGGSASRLTHGGGESVVASGIQSIAFEAGWSRTERQGIYLSDLATGTTRRLSPLGRYAEIPALSLDGRWLAYELLGEERMEIVVQSTDGGEPNLMMPSPAHAPTFSPDGRFLAVHAVHPDLQRWQTAILSREGGPPLRWLDVHSETNSPWVGADALLISRTVEGTSNIYRFSFDDSELRPVTSFNEGEIFAFALSPDEEKLVVARGNWVSDLLLYEGLLRPGE